MAKISGSCLCGSVAYSGEAEPVFSANCHCTDCRKSSAAGHMSLMAVAEPALAMSGDVTSYAMTADSGATVTHNFCPKCGSQMYNKSTKFPDVVMLVASNLDDPELFAPAVSVYTSRALRWDQPNAQTQQFETTPESGE